MAFQKHMIMVQIGASLRARYNVPSKLKKTSFACLLKPVALRSKSANETSIIISLC